MINLENELTKLSEEFNISEKELLTWFRSSIRQSWGNSPMKRFMEDNHKYKVVNTNKRSSKRYPEVWKMKCAICGEENSPAGMELDHISGDNKLKNFDDSESFIKSILFTTKDNLQWLCIDKYRVENKKKVLVRHGCHEIKTYAESNQLSFKEAMITKYSIDIIKNKKDKEFFTDRELEIPSNVELRRKGIISILLTELNNDFTIKQ